MIMIYLSMIDIEEDKSKFIKIYDKYKNLMFYLAREILKDNHLAEDALQEAFIRIAKNLHKINDIYSHETKGFVVIIVKHVSITMLKKKNKKTISFEDMSEVLSTENYLTDDYLDKINYETIVNEIRNLPEIYKTVIYLDLVFELGNKEISQTIGISIDAAKKRKERGRKILRQRLEKEGITYDC